MLRFLLFIISFTYSISSAHCISISKSLTAVFPPQSKLCLEMKLSGGSVTPRSQSTITKKTANDLHINNHDDGGAGVVIATSAALGSLLQGYDTGVLGGALLYIIPEYNIGNRPLMQGLVVTMSAIGSIIGSLVASILSDSIGRRGTLRVSSVVFLMSFTMLLWSPVIEVLVVGRLLMGIAIGISSATAPIYIAECAVSSRRGALATIPQLCVSSGIMLALTLSFLVTLMKKSSWRLMVGFAIIPAIAQAICLNLFLPESPRWLLQHRSRQSAVRALGRLRGVPRGAPIPDYLEQELETMVEHNTSKSKTAGWGALTEPAILRLVVICSVLQMFQQLSGINAVVYFTPHTLKLANVPHLFRHLGVSENSAALLASSLAYAPKIPALFLAMRLMDSLGRRKLLKTFIPCLSVCLFSLAGVFAHLSRLPIGAPLGLAPPIIALVGLTLYGVVFSLSLGPIPNIVSSELFPSRCRSAAMTCSLASQYIFNTLVGLAFPILKHRFGSHVVFGGFGTMCLFAYVFVHHFIPETSGSILQDS